jgi:HNH endonuclease
MFEPRQIISYLEMCQFEGVSLQKGMNFHLRPGVSVILMSRRPGAPYADSVSEDGQVLTYEGHDALRRKGGPDPKKLDQPARSLGGGPTENLLFYEAARSAAQGGSEAELVRVYEKIRPGIWAYNGIFRLCDAWLEKENNRKVFKFRLELCGEGSLPDLHPRSLDLPHERIIPSSVKLEVWKRDRGRCVLCGSTNNLHFDHDIPFSKGGSSLVPSNIRLLCAKHNLAKHDKIE